MSITKETRRESYSVIKPLSPSRRQLILDILSDQQMTAQDIAEALYFQGHVPKIERNFAAPRLTELEKRGKVRAIGKKICPRTGRKVAIWEAIKESDNGDESY